MTIHDYIDVALVAAACVAWWRSRQPEAGGAVVGLILTHLIGRQVMAVSDDPLPILAVGFTGVAMAYLLSPLLTDFGKVVGTIYAIMGSMCFASVAVGHNPAIGQGIGFNVWNALSVMLHITAVMVIVGVNDYARIRRARPDR